MRKHQDWWEDVKRFNIKFGKHIGNTPSIPNETINTTERIELIQHYVNGLVWSIEHKSLSSIISSIVILVGLLISTALMYGVDLRPIWEEVRDANMAGEKPDIDKLIKEQQGSIGLAKTSKQIPKVED